MCNDCDRIYYEPIRRLDEKIDNLINALNTIRAIADRCRCDKGYPGGCGCGKSCGEVAEDAIDKHFKP